ncbi:hypothetical protein, conserved [Eimeria tenella]|uniref:RAP domain-containing protein n=1 Tax=Eimeria tenella TaxID=5802 RepID=U6L202_EIMTE|nr:hypothetical protein, conserved [Eimeria tenella]CDJ42624.1 hypothetical protein, conserved [Eimeria tenella]|eukprot:XP_013233374.1 hypothetical protein, conserved [Eimeria tenella]
MLPLIEAALGRSWGPRGPPLLQLRPRGPLEAAAAAAAATAAATTAAAAAAATAKTRPTLPSGDGSLAAVGACLAFSSSSSSSSRRAVRLLHNVPAAPGDHAVAAALLQQPAELLQFACSSAAHDLPTLQQVLQQLARASRDAAAAAALQQDPQQQQLLQQLLQQIGLLLPEADGRLLSKIASSLALLRISNLATQQLASQLGREVVGRGDSLSPRALCAAAAALALLQVRDSVLQQFVWGEVQQQLQQLLPQDLCLLLHAMRRWGAYSRSTCDLLLQRMSEEINSFTAADVTAAVDALASMGLARGFLLRQLSSLAFENLHKFNQQQLLLLLRGLARLRFLTPANCDTLLQHFRIDCSTQQQQQQQQQQGWNPHRSAMLLGGLALCDLGPPHSGILDLLLELLQHVEQALPGAAAAAAAPAAAAAAAPAAAARHPTLGIAALVEAAYAICYFQLQDKASLLQRLLNEIYSKPVTRDRNLLMKIQEVQKTAELEMRSCSSQMPLAWRTASEEAARQLQDRQETSGLHAEVALCLELLRGPYRLQLQRSSSCGGYRVDFYDEETKIIVEVDMIYRHAPCTLKHRHLNLQGFLPVSVEYWQWRRCRSEEEQLLYLQQRLTPALQQLGRLQLTQLV